MDIQFCDNDATARLFDPVPAGNALHHQNQVAEVGLGHLDQSLRCNFHVPVHRDLSLMDHNEDAHRTPLDAILQLYVYYTYEKEIDYYRG